MQNRPVHIRTDILNKSVEQFSLNWENVFLGIITMHIIYFLSNRLSRSA